MFRPVSGHLERISEATKLLKKMNDVSIERPLVCFSTVINLLFLRSLVQKISNKE